MDIKDLVTECRNSCFAKDNYSVNVKLQYFTSSLLLHLWASKEEELEKENPKTLNFDNKLNDELMETSVPDFQRKNDKWNIDMKTKFIENLLKGVRTEILLFKLTGWIDGQIIDGLQRTTAIFDFLQGRVKPFGKTINELKDVLGHFNTDITVKIYTFQNWEEVGKFYIGMNENITHSKEDIQKAKDYFLEKHNIKL